MTTGTLFERNKLRRAVRDFSIDQNVGYFITANFNRVTNDAAARKTLKAWHAHVDKQLLGGSWSKKTSGVRTFFLAYVEHLNSNMHWHLLLRLGANADDDRFVEVAADCWQTLVRSGSMDVRKLNTDADKARAASYATKELWRDDALVRFIVSTEFTN